MSRAFRGVASALSASTSTRTGRVALTVASVGAATASSSAFLGYRMFATVHVDRQRFFTDNFVMTPESFRIPYKEVALSTEDEIPLQAWLMEQTCKGKSSNRIVMLCAPYNQSKSDLLSICRGLWESGHTVFVFDFRSHSPGGVVPQSIGYYELMDARAALKWLRENKPDDARIGLMGCSMGGAVSLALAEEDPTDLVGVLADCPFYDLADVVYFRVFQNKKHHPIFYYAPSWYRTYSIGWFKWFTKMLRGYDPSTVGAGPNISQLKIPMLLVHSEDDSVVPVRHSLRLHEEAPVKHKTLVLVPHTEHLGTFFADEQVYVKRIARFLDAHFEGEEVGGDIPQDYETVKADAPLSTNAYQ